MSNKGSASIVIAPNIFKPNVPMTRKRTTRGGKFEKKKREVKMTFKKGKNRAYVVT
jgi:hypothetical protein